VLKNWQRTSGFHIPADTKILAFLRNNFCSADFCESLNRSVHISGRWIGWRVFPHGWIFSRHREIKESPFWRVKLSFGRIQQLPRALTECEMRALLEQSQRSCPNIENAPRSSKSKKQNIPREYRLVRNLALVDLLFATGMRVGEASTLDIQDFVIDESRFGVKGKGGIDRLAFVVDDQSIRIQKKHLAARKCIESQSPALFLNASGNRLSTQGIANVLAQFRTDAGIQRHITPHMIRHTVATLLLRNSVDIRIVQEFLGHASIATTQRYTYVSKEHLIGEPQKHHPSFGLRGDENDAKP
jgi:site-specific recombinase XerD